MKEDLRGYQNCFLDQASLASLGVIMGTPLDVDETMEDFSSTRFFQPWVPDKIISKSSEDEENKWMDRYTPELACSEWQYGDMKTRWFHRCLKKLHSWEPDLWEPDLWDPWKYVATI